MFCVVVVVFIHHLDMIRALDLTHLLCHLVMLMPTISARAAIMQQLVAPTIMTLPSPVLEVSFHCNSGTLVHRVASPSALYSTSNIY